MSNGNHICWPCWLSCRSGWPPYLLCCPSLAIPFSASALPLHHGVTCGLVSLFLCVSRWWELVFSPEPGSLLSWCPCGGGTLLGGALILGLMVQFLPPDPAGGLPSHAHSILGSALAKEESSGLSGPKRFLSLARPRALRPQK